MVDMCHIVQVAVFDFEVLEQVVEMAHIARIQFQHIWYAARLGRWTKLPSGVLLAAHTAVASQTAAFPPSKEAAPPIPLFGRRNVCHLL